MYIRDITLILFTFLSCTICAAQPTAPIKQKEKVSLAVYKPTEEGCRILDAVMNSKLRPIHWEGLYDFYEIFVSIKGADTIIIKSENFFRYEVYEKTGRIGIPFLNIASQPNRSPTRIDILSRFQRGFFGVVPYKDRLFFLLDSQDKKEREIIEYFFDKTSGSRVFERGAIYMYTRDFIWNFKVEGQMATLQSITIDQGLKNDYQDKESDVEVIFEY